jgi:hypothetical protein
MLVWRFVANFDPAARFLAPGEAQVVLAAPGDYIVWHEHRTVYQGHSFNLPPAMPDRARYRVHAPDGRPVSVELYGGMSAQGTDGDSVSVAHFEATDRKIYPPLAALRPTNCSSFRSSAPARRGTMGLYRIASRYYW